MKSNTTVQYQKENSRTGYYLRQETFSDQNLPKTGTHFHSCLEFVYILDGSVSISVDDRTEILKEGDAALILPFSLHSFRFPAGSAFMYRSVVFSEEYVSSFCRFIEGRCGTRIAFRLSAGFEKMVWSDLFSMDGLNDDPESVMAAKTCLYAICTDYCREVPLQQIEPRNRSLMIQANDYIRKHYNEKISLKNLSRQLGYSYSYFSHNFTRSFHVSFTSYLNMYRLSRAEAELERTDDSIQEVADNNGFSSVRNFNYFFKMVHGVSPSEYRRNSLWNAPVEKASVKKQELKENSAD